MSPRQARYERILARVHDLMNGQTDLTGWALREAVYKLLEQLPKWRMQAWLAEHGDALDRRIKAGAPRKAGLLRPTTTK